MILRKPYAFLIKNFKRFHFLLLLAMIYIGYTSNRLASFFNKYDKTKQAIFNISLSKEYVTILMYIVGFIIIGITVFIYILLKQKDKPRKLYVAMILYYIIVLILFMINSNYLNTIQYEGLEPQIIRIFRDINFVNVVIQSLFSLFIVVRTVGFDIKKFNFGEDIENLKIDVTDNEEFELTSGIDTDDVRRKYRKQIREFKYFYIENKSVIIGLFILFLILLASSFLFYTQISNKIYKQTDIISLNNLNLKINNVYSTKLNYKGKNISEKGYTYIVIDMNLNNQDTLDRKLNLENLKIVIGDVIYNSNITKYEYFRDIGTGYIEQKILKNTIRDYIVVFKIKDEDLNKKMILRYADYVNFNNNKLSTKYTRIKINSTNLDSVSKLIKAELNKEVYYGLSLLKETTLKITSIDFNSKYEYTIDKTKHYIIEPLSTNTILRLSYDFKLDNNIKYINTFEDFLNKFGSVVYKVGNKSYIANYTNLTPTNYKESDIYLSVDKKISEASNIELVVTIRNKIYTYILK